MLGDDHVIYLPSSFCTQAASKQDASEALCLSSHTTRGTLVGAADLSLPSLGNYALVFEPLVACLFIIAPGVPVWLQPVEIV